MSTARPTDVVVIGLGAAGAVAAHRLANAGARVVAFEAGPRRRAGDYAFDELRNDVRNWIAAKTAREIPTWRPDAGTEATTAHAGRIVSLIGNGIGGGTLQYAGQHFRFLPWHFRLVSETVARYGHSALPPDCTATDWPVGYDDLEPHYAAVERLIGVSGIAGNVGGAVREGGNLLEAPRSADYPVAPLRRTGWTELVDGAARRLGLHPFPGPAAVLSEAWEGRPGCSYCGFCNFNGCHNGAKSSTDVTVVPAAEATGNLEVVTDARVLEIVVDDEGRACGVRVEREGRVELQPASVVFLSAHVFENTRLLLLSRSKAFPRGLANNGGQVGRNTMSHVYVAVDGVFPGTRLNRFGGTYSQCTSLDDWNADVFDHTGLGFVGGACISAIQEAKPIATALSTPPGVPRFGAGWKAWLRANGNAVGRLMATAESLPYADSQLDLDPSITDDRGLPVIRITYRIHDQERRRYAFLADRMAEILLEAGAAETWSAFPLLPAAPFQSTFGATRMGADPATSVTDPWCLAHEVPNLALSGAGCFPTSGGYNPTATIQALALRTADRILSEWDRLAA